MSRWKKKHSELLKPHRFASTNYGTEKIPQCWTSIRRLPSQQPTVLRQIAHIPQLPKALALPQNSSRLKNMVPIDSRLNTAGIQYS